MASPGTTWTPQALSRPQRFLLPPPRRGKVWIGLVGIDSVVQTVAAGSFSGAVSPDLVVLPYPTPGPPTPGTGGGPIQRYRVMVVDAAGNAYGETVNAKITDITDELNGTGSAAVEVPITDPTVGLYQTVTREVAIYRDGLVPPFWRGPIVRPSAASTPPAKVSFQAQNPLWYFSHRYFGGPAFPTNYLVNGSFEVWSGGLPVDWTVSSPSAPTVTQTTLQSNPGLVALGYSAVQLDGGNPTGDLFLHQIATSQIPLNSEGIYLTLSGWFKITALGTGGLPLGGRGLYIALVNGSTLEADNVTNFDSTTPQGLWTPVSVSIQLPAAGTGGAWGVDSRCYCPTNGEIIWDAMLLSGPESLSPVEPAGSDQALILENIVRYAQGRAAVGGVGFPQDFTKSDLVIGTNCPATGTLRSDLVYDYSNQRAILDSLNDFPTFQVEQDFAVENNTPTTRTFTTYGRAVTDGVTTAGSNTFGSVSANFTEADVYQPLNHMNIPAGSLILPGTTPTAVNFSGPGATASGTGLSVFIGGRRGSWKPNTALFMDHTGTNLAKVDPYDQDGEQMANSVSMTSPSGTNGQYVGVALKGVKIGTLTSARNSGTTYTSLAVTAITAPVNTGDWMRLGVSVWQPGVGQEGEIVIASAPAAVGATTVFIQSHLMGSTWGIGAVVADFTPTVTMEDVLSATPPAPIGALASLANAEMLARSDAVFILTVVTENDFIDKRCGGVPLVAGDVLPVTVQYGNFLNLVDVPFRVISWSLDADTDSYTLTLNKVAL